MGGVVGEDTVVMPVMLITRKQVVHGGGLLGDSRGVSDIGRVRVRKGKGQRVWNLL
jgi:hypothetical protein